MATSSRPLPSSRRWTSWPTASASTGWRSAGATRRSPATSTRRASSSPRARWGSAWRPSRSRSARPFRRPRPAGAAASATLRCSTSPAARGSTARTAAAPAVRARRAGWPLPARRAHAGGRGLLRSADDDAGQGPARQRVGELRLRRPGRRARRRGGHGRDPGAPRRLRPRRRPRPQPPGGRGADPRRHPHGARLRPGRASRRRERAGAHRVVHGLRHPARGRHARADGAPHRVARGRGPVRRQRPRRVRCDPGLRRRRQRRARRDRRALRRAADHGRPRARGADWAARAMNLFEGVRVLDLSRMLAGPYGSMLLADMGAEVLKIEAPDGGDPVRMGLPMGDLSGGMFGAFSVAGALLRRARTGVGARVDLSLLDCQVSLLSYLAQYFWTDGVVPRPMGSAHASVVPYGSLATRDGHLIVAVFERFWPAFCRAAAHPEWAADPRFAANGDRVANRAALMALIEHAFAGRTTHEWLERLHAEGVPAAPIQTVDRVLSDPQVHYRGMVVEVEHERLGRVPTLGTPIKVDGATRFTPAPPPQLGQHTDEVLATLLKYPGARLEALRREGVIA